MLLEIALTLVAERRVERVCDCLCVCVGLFNRSVLSFVERQLFSSSLSSGNLGLVEQQFSQGTGQ